MTEIAPQNESAPPDAGQHRSRPILLLLPGLLCDARLWRDQIEALREEADCIVADLTQDDTVGGMAERALAGIDACFGAEARFALCGHSMGGYVAQEIMRRAAPRVERLALIATSARPDTEEQARRRRGLIALSRGGHFRGVTPRLLPRLVHPDRLDGSLGQEVIAMAERVGRDAFLRQQAAILGRPDSRPDLPHTSVPALAGVGAEDLLTPPELAEEIASLLPGARLVRFPHCGHLPPMEQPEATTAALRAWLRSG